MAAADTCLALLFPLSDCAIAGVRSFAGARTLDSTSCGYRELSSCSTATVYPLSWKKAKFKKGRRMTGFQLVECLSLKACRAQVASTTDASTMVDGSIDSSNFSSLPAKRIVVGVGGLSVDYLACVASFPKPDDKIRTTDFQVQGGGCVGNALTAAARLGLTPRVVSKVADDGPGKQTVACLQAEGIDTSYMVVSFPRVLLAFFKCPAASELVLFLLLLLSLELFYEVLDLYPHVCPTSLLEVAEGGNSPFTYIIVDKQQSTRTCIHTPISSTFIADDLTAEAVHLVLSQANIVYFDGRFSDAALVIAKEAARLQLPILLDAENWKREGLNELMQFADYVICSGSFPQGWTKVDNLAEAVLAMALSLPRLKFLIVTLGASGCVMLERIHPDVATAETLDVKKTLETLQQESRGSNTGKPFVISSKVGRLTSLALGDKGIHGRLVIGTAENIPPEELVDTTGAGDAFVGAVLYSLCAGYAVERMLPLAAVVAAFCCRAVGARPGLPNRLNPKVLSLL